MLQKMNIMVKKTLLVLMITVLLGGSILPIQGTTHAQPPNNPNGAQAATVRWLSELAPEILTLFITQMWSADFPQREPSWRINEIIDENGEKKAPERQRLLRWDRRPPNEILVNGFIPQVVDQHLLPEVTDLYEYVKSNTKSIYVSTTKTRYKDGKRQQPWSPRTRDNGVIYQYEIFAPGGIDVNRSFGEQSPWPNQLEVAFPGGISPEFIRSVREIHDGRIQRIWINPNFQDPGELEGISASSSTEQVLWHPDHPDGNHKDPNVYSSTNPDEDMFGGNGYVPDKEDFPVFKESNILPDDEYQIQIDGHIIIGIESDQISNMYNLGLDKQKWNFVYDNSKQAYKIISSQSPNLLLTWDSNHSGQVIGYEDHGYSDQYWRIEKMDKFYKIKSHKDPSQVLYHLNNSEGQPLEVRYDDGSEGQKW
ncbi:hypothetical protein B7C51_03105 [Paenibacillus larvae subsp. pulvifaciens]|uniref:Pierisin-like domain-containing protein n=1 Tax=Paenibacillus larvae subsp. pulvifaciens TaxID=1477 RepID=A0A1V0UPP9_9BACL|nr:RICIN domain-containing protein [Paenibacillus larvae]ARF67010.1 hypothetical protein B7C51_03105 [Paenibacillus larvae subsp. pulvifaciens]